MEDRTALLRAIPQVDELLREPGLARAAQQQGRAAALGAVPPEAGFRAVELSHGADRAAVCRLYPELRDMLLLRDSDAHYLHLMQENMAQVELPERSAKALLDVLRGCGPGCFLEPDP